ncbi:hypothetical protein ACVWY2_001599 [Bradyrhizobium sp. JR6.1]
MVVNCGPENEPCSTGHMIGVGDVLEMLQPVAGDHGGPAAADRGIIGLDEFAVVHILQALVARQHRLLICRAHIGEDQAVAFLHRIPGLAHLALEQAAFGLAGLFEAAALGVELPAVIAATDAVFLDLAVIECGAAMAAARMQEAHPAMPVAEQDQVFAECTDFSGDIGGVADEADRVPVAAQQLAHRCAADDRGELGPGGGRFHRIGRAEIAVPLGDGHAGFLPPPDSCRRSLCR